MLNKLKNWVKTETNYSKSNNELFNLFNEEVKEILDQDIPKNVKESLNKLIKCLSEIDMMRIPIEDQSKIEKILSREIPNQIENYLIIPKAHAVSMILDNGKTAKQTLIDLMINQEQKIESIWNNAVRQHAQSLVDKSKEKKDLIKKDFFDL